VAQEHHLNAAPHDGHIVGVQQTKACHHHKCVLGFLSRGPRAAISTT
jgi:hypothetical protein